MLYKVKCSDEYQKALPNSDNSIFLARHLCKVRRRVHHHSMRVKRSSVKFMTMPFHPNHHNFVIQMALPHLRLPAVLLEEGASLLLGNSPLRRFGLAYQRNTRTYHEPPEAGLVLVML